MVAYVHVWKAKVADDNVDALLWDELQGRFPELLDAG